MDRQQNHAPAKDRIMASVFDQTAVGICITNRERRFVLVNDAYCRTYGYSRDELIGQPFTVVVPEENRQAANDLHDAFIAGSPEIPLEWTVQRKGGDRITVVTTAALLVDADGERYKITTVTDVSELRSAQRLVNRFGRIMERSYDEIYVFSADTYRFLQVNHAAVSNSGYTEPELLSMTPMELNPSLTKQQMDRSVEGLRRGEIDIRVFETRQVRKDGTRYPVDVRLQLMGHEEPAVFVAIVQDSTERKELNRINQELRMAHEIQNNLMPSESPEVPGYSLWGISKPCYEVGGDYFDFIPVDDGCTAVCLGDVSGKGMPAALLMSNVQAIIRTETLQKQGVSQCLQAANRMLVRNTTSNRFISLLYGILDPETHAFSYANAGHIPPLVLRQDGQLEQPAKGQMVLGFSEEEQYVETTLKLGIGDILVLCSDGITEAVDDSGRFFGEERLIEALRSNRELDAGQLARKILETVVRFHGDTPQDDDETLVIVKRES